MDTEEKGSHTTSRPTSVSSILQYWFHLRTMAAGMKISTPHRLHQRSQHLLTAPCCGWIHTSLTLLFQLFQPLTSSSFSKASSSPSMSPTRPPVRVLNKLPYPLPKSLETDSPRDRRCLPGTALNRPSSGAVDSCIFEGRVSVPCWKLKKDGISSQLLAMFSPERVSSSCFSSFEVYAA